MAIRVKRTKKCTKTSKCFNRKTNQTAKKLAKNLANPPGEHPSNFVGTSFGDDVK